METITNLIKDTPIPKMVKVRQNFDKTCIPESDIPGIITRELDRPEIGGKIQPGQKIAITCGSRGINHNAVMARAIVDFVKSKGAEPYIVAAMGSHGGATAEGQLQILKDYGVTEEAMGCPVKSSMETVQIGISGMRHQPVFMDKNASEADGIILFNRIKPHTSFRGPYESGLMKMMAIGLGKQFGAEMIHADGFGHFREYIPEYGKAILKHAPVLCGLAVLENAYDQTRELEALTPQEIIDREPELLLRAKSYMPRILFDSCDVLIVDRMGKDISGDGMDPNISGRFPTPYASGGIQAQRVAVLGLTEASHGNACGIGLADVTTRRLFEEMDLEQTYPNAITNTVVEEMKIPMILASDRLAIQMALKSCTDVDHARPRVVRIRTTLAMRHIEISEAMLDQARQTPGVTVLGQAADMPFDENGNLF